MSILLQSLLVVVSIVASAPLQVGNKVENTLVARSPDEYHQSGAAWDKGSTTGYHEASSSAKAGFNSHNQPVASKSSNEVEYYNKQYNKGKIASEYAYKHDKDHPFW
ncbi:hypothetical protein O181_033216 [Austropuccinia psidii MF-1]|uniref:Secreted protein n=1 Tax=Austropuccinia psidii MF-1 TaxID=1389203 RepID=A0A9Q3CYB2_9BASI|nr:hypothetical protein [Austropuccinia psidii MF-1]